MFSTIEKIMLGICAAFGLFCLFFALNKRARTAIRRYVTSNVAIEELAFKEGYV